ncbi:MAG: PP2C family protein-serine/threonine phosphatase [Acidobacteriota bacterium]|nr:PP2C family protein-serine/threonine phosphatase [Acidobacteriota bacterium]
MGSFRICKGEVWGGIADADKDLETGAISASLYARSAEGGKGGDIYYLSVCCGDRLTRIAVADVVGHGKTVSDMSDWVYRELRDHMNDQHGNAMVQRLNNKVEERGLTAMTTMAVAGLIVKDSNLYFTYAGHPPMLIRRGGSDQWEKATIPRVRATNLPLGVVRDSPYEQQTTRLADGDQLFIYTDGLLEAPSPDGELFGEQRMRTALTELAGESPKRVKEGMLETVQAHTGGALDHDDMTMLVVQSHVG